MGEDNGLMRKLIFFLLILLLLPTIGMAKPDQKEKFSYSIRNYELSIEPARIYQSQYVTFSYTNKNRKEQDMDLIIGFSDTNAKPTTAIIKVKDKDGKEKTSKVRTDWNNITHLFSNKVNWYELQKVETSKKDETIEMRFYLELAEGTQGKYDIGLKPNGMTIWEAELSGEIIYLDPFWNTYNSTDFDLGTYDNTFYNTTSNATEINRSTGKEVNTPHTYRNLPNSQNEVDWINMSGNVLLLHLNGEPTNQTDATDSSGLGYNMNLNLLGDATCVGQEGRINGACNFTNRNGWLRENWAEWEDDNSVGTINAWVKMEPGQAGGFIFTTRDNTGDPYFYTAITTNNIYLRQKSFDTADGVRHISDEKFDRDDGIWHMATWGSDNSDYYLWVDGRRVPSEVYTGTNSGDWFDTGNGRDYLAIGSWFTGAGARTGFNGSIDEVGIWERLLTDEEIRTMYMGGSIARNQTHWVNTEGIELMWHMNNDNEYGEDATLIYDHSERGFDGTMIGGTSSTTGIIENGTNLDGQNGTWINITKGMHTIENGTISMWFKPNVNIDTAADYNFLLLDNAAGFVEKDIMLFIHKEAAWICSNATMCFTIDNGASYDYVESDTTTWSADTWYHIVVTWQDMKMWVNGVQQTMTNTATNGAFGNDNIKIGSSNGAAYNINATLDEIAIFSRELSTEEIVHLYQTGRYTGHNGTYTSQVFDAGQVATWHNITWNNDVGELPNNDDDTIINMTGNRLLYHFNENDGTTTVDTSGDNQNGTLFNAIPDAPGIIGRGVYFDGDGDYVNVSDQSYYDPNDRLTVAAWIRPFSHGVNDYGVIMSKWGYQTAAERGWEFHIGEGNGDYLGFRMNNDNFWSNNGQITLDEWQHVAVTHREEGDVTFYLNGAAIGNTLAGGNPSDNTFEVLIGARANDTTNEFNGSMDEVAFFDRELSATEINELYQRGLGQINMSYRNCTLINCSDGTWSVWQTQSPVTLGLTSQYLQYRTYMYHNDLFDTAQLFNVSIDYYVPTFPPNVTLNTSNNTYFFGNETNLTFYFTDQNNETTNCTLYIDGTAEYTNETAPRNTSITFTTYYNTTSTHIWNVTCIDHESSESSTTNTFRVFARFTEQEAEDNIIVWGIVFLGCFGLVFKRGYKILGLILMTTMVFLLGILQNIDPTLIVIFGTMMVFITLMEMFKRLNG